MAVGVELGMRIFLTASHTITSGDAPDPCDPDWVRVNKMNGLRTKLVLGWKSTFSFNTYPECQLKKYLRNPKKHNFWK